MIMIENELIRVDCKKQTHDYIGDGVYVGFDGYQVWLATDRGTGECHLIALEPKVLNELFHYARKRMSNG